MATRTFRLFRVVPLGAAVMLTYLIPIPAHADFFDDARKTFTSDIPHFFQDDIPCFFGGQPTSGTRKSCKSPDHPVTGANPKDPTHSYPASKDSAPNPAQP